MIRLPHFLEPKPLTEHKPAIAPAPGDVTCVLVVDDEPAIRTLVAASLRRDGYFVAEAANGQLALEVAKAAGRVDVVVTDIRMPEMNGFAMTEALRVLQPDLDVILVTGYPVDHSKIGPHTRLLNKPFRHNDLLHAVEDMAGSPHRAN